MWLKKDKQPELLEEIKKLKLKVSLLESEIDDIKLNFAGIKKKLDKKLNINRIKDEEEQEENSFNKIILPDRR